MKHLLPFILLATFLISANSFARKPAVEDFVGVDPVAESIPAEATRVIFHYGESVKVGQANNNNTTSTPSSTSATSGWMGLLVLAGFIAFPFMVWFGITSTYNEETGEVEAQADGEVTNLEDFRQAHDEDKDDQKKAS